AEIALSAEAGSSTLKRAPQALERHLERRITRGGGHQQQAGEQQADRPPCTVFEEILLQPHQADGQEKHAAGEDVPHLFGMLPSTKTQATTGRSASSRRASRRIPAFARAPSQRSDAARPSSSSEVITWPGITKRNDLATMRICGEETRSHAIWSAK